MAVRQWRSQPDQCNLADSCLCKQRRLLCDMLDAEALEQGKVGRLACSLGARHTTCKCHEASQHILSGAASLRLKVSACQSLQDKTLDKSA